MTASDTGTRLSGGDWGHSGYSGYSEATLRANLAALARVDPELAERLCLPVADDHVVADARGALQLREHRALRPLAQDPGPLGREVDEALAAAAGARPVLAFGVGLGEALDALAARGARAVAWERDPWLLRLALSRRDRSAELRSERLRLLLGIDLLDAPRDAAVVRHPLLARIYRHEAALLASGPGARRALLCTGGLFVDDLAASLARRGWSLYGLDLERVAVEELDRAARRFAPGLVAAINYTNGLAELAERHGAPLVCWEIDPAAGPPRPLSAPAPRASLFTYRRAMVEPWRAAGFERVEYLPLAADPEARAPVALDLLPEAERDRYVTPLALVGSSMVANAKRFERLFLAYWTRWRGDAAAEAEGRATLARVLAAQREDATRYRVPELLAEAAPGFAAAVRAAGAEHDPDVLAGEIASAEKRLNWAARLGPLGLRAWGDEGWRQLERFGVRAMGPAGHRRELNRVYSGATVNVDLGRLYQSDIVTMRVFDALACGGFVLAEHSPALEELFEVGREVESYRTQDELVAKASHYAARPEEARAIAARGRAAVLERHTIDGRVAHMLAAAGVEA